MSVFKLNWLVNTSIKTLSDEFNILEKISRQSGDIALGVDKGGAGDQGIMYGYAETGTEELMPLGNAKRVYEIIDHAYFYTKTLSVKLQ